MINRMTEQKFRAVINKRFFGVLTRGGHRPNSQACALEAYAAMIHHEWTDSPVKLHIPDVRPLNDGPWSSNRVRTEALIPLVVTLSRWREWPLGRRRRWNKVIVLRTVREIVAELPGMEPRVEAACRAAATFEGATRAAEAAQLARQAWATMVTRAAWAAWMTCRVGMRMAAPDVVLQRACRIWIEAASGG